MSLVWAMGLISGLILSTFRSQVAILVAASISERPFSHQTSSIKGRLYEHRVGRYIGQIESQIMFFRLSRQILDPLFMEHVWYFKKIVGSWINFNWNYDPPDFELMKYLPDWVRPYTPLYPDIIKLVIYYNKLGR